ncbi:MAG: SDR family oxidoreductase [Candidatus Pacebacteria bacterium]|nr:SDR family oxidoreductase [Candidatus Paceibacterota bacterium]
MIESGKTYVVMGLLDAESLAYTIGKTIARMGGKVIHTVQSEVFKRRFLDSSKQLTDEERAGLDLRYCDITKPEQVEAVFAGMTGLGGVVHSIAYANPKTCLGEEFHTDAIDDITLSHHISCVSLATLARYAVPAMTGGGAIVSMTFDTSHVYPHYNWMGVQKAALEALVRALARRHGRDRVRVNAVSAGPLWTKAASKIPGFGELTKVWNANSPLPWNTRDDKQAVANAVVFLLGPYSEKITGQILAVDGGAAVMGGPRLAHEMANSEPRDA